MPELPEVETVREGLARHVLGTQITDLQVLRPASIRKQPGGETEFSQRLLGRQITEVARRGKFMWLNLDNGQGLVAHLGMSGQLLVKSQPDPPAHRHLRIRIHLSPGQVGEVISPDAAGPLQADPPRVLDFVDQRVFGYLTVTDLIPTTDGAPAGWGTTQSLLPPLVAHIARDLLDDALDLDAVYTKLRAKRTGLKRVLLDQTVASGIGNIYADEALWLAQVHPEQLTSSLSKPRFEKVFTAARQVMQDALLAGGTSFDALYVNVNGQSGYFSRSLRAYGRTDQPCERCGTPIRRIQSAGRSTHYCPKCQTRR